MTTDSFAKVSDYKIFKLRNWILLIFRLPEKISPKPKESAVQSASIKVITDDHRLY